MAGLIVGKKSLPKRLLRVFAALSSIIVVASATYLVCWKLDNDRISEQASSFTDTTNVKEIDDNDNTKIINESNPYWDYTKMKLIDVDFTELRKINSDTVGWIQVGGTNISYPFVQANDNDYYLTHAFDKSYNAAGWVYMDYRNSITSRERNTIIYAHSRLDETMFGSLKNILTSGWLDNKDNYIVRMSTDSENTLWQVFSVYHIPTTNDYLQTSFGSNSQFNEFANILLDRSDYNFNTTVSGTDRILTLSTCYGYTERVVLHAKLIKILEK